MRSGTFRWCQNSPSLDAIALFSKTITGVRYIAEGFSGLGIKMSTADQEFDSVGDYMGWPRGWVLTGGCKVSGQGSFGGIL
jgi:hypothetical protein